MLFSSKSKKITILLNLSLSALDQLGTLVDLKTKDELVGEIIGLLRSPAINVISGLKSAGTTLAGLVKTLAEREN